MTVDPFALRNGVELGPSEVIHGDSLEVLPRLEADSVDAVVCDPPYGLSREPDIVEVLTHWLNGDDYRHGSGSAKSPQRLFTDVLRDAVVDHPDRLDPGIGQECITFRITCLPATMRALAVQFQDQSTIGKVEVHGEGAPGRIEHLLMDKGNSQIREGLRDRKFRLRVRKDAGDVSPRTVLRQGDTTSFGVAIRLRDDPMTEAERPPDVVTFPGAELRAVLALDATRRTGELRSAEAAGEPYLTLSPDGSEPIGATPGAGGSPAVSEAGSTHLVVDPADGTFTFDVEFWLPMGWHVSQPKAMAGFMGKTWDSFVPGPALWREVFRVLKPGGHALVFAGTRTQDLMGIALRMAGFEIRDCLCWLYGSGFPKSMAVGKAIDKAAGAEREVVADGQRFGRGSMRNRSRVEVGYRPTEINPDGGVATITAPATPEAQEWNGWGTALKPAFEPIVVARKPLTGTVAANVLQHGTGALNIDGCRIPTTDSLGGGAESRTSPEQKGNEGWTRPWMSDAEMQEAHAARVRANVAKAEDLGRWPANVLLDEDAAAMLDAATGDLGRSSGGVNTGGLRGRVYGDYRGRADHANAGGLGDSGGPSRFFYTAKASRKERTLGGLIDNAHPTVKPLALMRWLVRLVCPPGGLILDPFVGSGTTGMAAVLEGARFLGVEQDEEACWTAVGRIALTRHLALKSA